MQSHIESAVGEIISTQAQVNTDPGVPARPTRVLRSFRPSIPLLKHQRACAYIAGLQPLLRIDIMTPHLIFGTASFGMDLTEFQDPSSVQTLLKNIQDLGVHRLDSGARYPPMKPGRAEELIGETKELSGFFIIDTKVYTDTQTDGSGDLTSDAIEKSLQASLQRLKKSDGVGPTLMPTCALEESS